MQFDLENPNNWEDFFSISATATILGEFAYTPIPEIVIPYPLFSHVLLVSVTTDIPPNKQWRHGGYLNQKIPTGVLSIFAYSSRRLSINKPKLIIFPDITATYSVSYTVPTWFKSVIFNIWKYTGVDSSV